MLFLNTTLSGIEFGLCYAILALGLYISYTILDFPDLSVDGTFPLGGVIGTIVMYNLGMPPIVALIAAFLAGMAAGSITGLLHVKCGISKLLCGIIVMTALSSVTLALTMILTQRGQPAVLFDFVGNQIRGFFNMELTDGFTRMQKMLLSIAILVFILFVVKVLVDLFLKTKIGYMLRATGNNEQMVVAMGKDPGNFKILGLSLANGLVGISGCLYAQLMLQYDNGSGAGKVVIALASVIMGVTLFGNFKHLKGTTSVIIGALIYSLVLYYFTLIDKNGIFLKLFNAVFFAAILIFSNKFKDFHSKGAKALFKPKSETASSDGEKK